MIQRSNHNISRRYILNVPYYSQRLDVKDAFWQSRSCGIVALAMAMDYSFILAYRHDDKIYEKWLERDNHPLSSPSLQRRGKEGEVNAANLKYKKSVSRFIRQLIREGIFISARDPKHGWIHDGLVALAKKHGFKKSFRKEFPEVRFRIANVRRWTHKQISQETDVLRYIALRYIVALLTRGIPVLASFKNKKGRGGHLVLLVGFWSTMRRSLTSDVRRSSDVKERRATKGLYYHDPNARSRKSGAYRFIPTAQFLKHWKRRIIVVQK